MRTTHRHAWPAVVICLALVVSFVSGPVWAAEKSPAERLHTAAVTAYKRGKLRQAIELWSDALKLEANWKYAYNLANTQYEEGNGLAAWVAVKRAESLGPPAKHQGLVAELTSKVRALLFKDHARLVIEAGSLPDGTALMRDGAPLEPPYEVWTTTTESELAIDAPGFEPYRAKVVHPIGQRTDHKPRLVALTSVVAQVGRLVVTGPVGATLTVGGVVRGTLPIEAIELPVGSTNVSLTLPEHVAQTQDVTISPGQETHLDLPLRREVVVPPPDDDLSLPGWIMVGGGAALAGLGVGMLVWAGDAQDEVVAINEDPSRFEDYAAYVRAYDDARGAMDDRALAGQILLVTGGVAVVTGIAFLVLDDEPARDSGVVGSLVPITGGAVLVGGAKF